MLESIVCNLVTGGAGLLTGAQARWVGCGPDETQRIYFANHTSHADFILLWSVLPPRLRRNTRPVAAGDYWTKGKIRSYMIHRVFRGVLVDRGRLDRSANPIQPMLTGLDEGASLILFPEGTRGTGDDVQPFKSGIFHLAEERPNVDLVPVWMDNCYRIMPKGSLFPLPLLCSVAFGAPTRLRADEPKGVFLDRLRQSLIEMRRE